MAGKGLSGHESQRAASVDWFTPAWIFEALGLAFDLDPCAPVGGVPWVPAANHYSAHDNGLMKPWAGRVWLNPPYGNLTGKFLARMHAHRDGVALVFARTDTAWFHAYAANADAILFLEGRIAFVDARGVTSGSGAGAGSILIAWGEDNVAALRHFQTTRGGFLWLPTEERKAA